MAHIVRFSVDGLAGRHEPYAHTLHRDLNIFFVLNGTGKSSLLKILHSALCQDANLLVRVPFQRAEVTIFSLKYGKEFTTVIEKSSHRKKKTTALRALVDESD